MYFVRVAAVAARALASRGELGPLDESVLELRVWPADLDVNVHMNNARYLAAMELGRWDLLIRQRILGLALRRRWRPIVASASIQFRRSLKAFAPYRLRTRLACWDAKWWYVEQRFEQGDALVAIGVVKGLLRGPQGNVPAADLFRARDLAVASPPKPAWIASWEAAERQVASLAPPVSSRQPGATP